jgi:hypothetical protein
MIKHIVVTFREGPTRTFRIACALRVRERPAARSLILHRLLSDMQKRSIFQAAVIALAVIVLTNSARAWNKAGHMVVGAIAYDVLSKEHPERKQPRRLLGPLLEWLVIMLCGEPVAFLAQSTSLDPVPAFKRRRRNLLFPANVHPMKSMRVRPHVIPSAPRRDVLLRKCTRFRANLASAFFLFACHRAIIPSTQL